jgi:hypothetical protein
VISLTARLVPQPAFTVTAAVCSAPPAWNCRYSRHCPLFGNDASMVRSGPPSGVVASPPPGWVGTDRAHGHTGYRYRVAGDH